MSTHTPGQGIPPTSAGDDDRAEQRDAGQARQGPVPTPAGPIDVIGEAHEDAEELFGTFPVERELRRPRVVRTHLASWALTLSMFSLTISWFVAWGMPVALIAVVLSIVALRRRYENHAFAWWAFGLGAAAVLFSLLWLYWLIT